MSTAKIVGNRLRRYLGALLALGFGTTWWSLVPPAKAAPVALRDVAKPKVVIAPVVAPIAEPEDDPPIYVSMRLPDPKPRKRPTIVAPPTSPEPPIVVVTDLDPVTTPIAMPVADPIVVPEPEPEPDPALERLLREPIRTRSS